MNEAEYKRFVETCSELELYITIDSLGGFTWRMQHELSKDRVPEGEQAAIRQDVIKMEARLTLAVDQTVRFGVEPPRTEITNIWNETVMTGSDVYWLWFRWWDGWCKSLTNEQFREMDVDLAAKQNLEKWRPEGHWKV